MKFPTYKELGEIAAKEALDTFEYNGKTLREWIEIISAAELGTNLAEVGTDLVSKQAEQRWIPVTKEEVFKAGYEGREIRFRVDGRLFAIRELAQ